MRRVIQYPLILIFCLFCWINLPKDLADRFRSLAAAPLYKKRIDSPMDELARLQLENRTLKAQIDHIYEWVLQDQRVMQQVDFLQEASQQKLCVKKAAYLKELLADQCLSMPAQVTYRDPSSWSSSLWVNVGQESNRALQKKVVAKNSPVLSDGALIGVVEYVGEKQSRIRLITDSGLSPSVRVVRGGLQNRELAHQISLLLKQMEKRDDLFLSSDEKRQLLDQLNRIKKTSCSQWEDGYLAKGEIHGSSAPFWRSRSPLLRGIGFNYDYPDEEGPAHYLKSEGAASLLKEGDLLVTTGLDGVFPAGLPVGTVMKIDPLKEGSYYYEVDVSPQASNLNDLHTLFIMPPLSE
jgi:rod shape-determining protein MreC